jgi:hydroxymethylpyrimidine pyrophosphatase-like HAD family hydrolase
VTDLDGTVVHEAEGRAYFPPSVEFALRDLYQLGRPLFLNTLRFPLSVLRTFGREWYALSNAPIPVVTLNGSLLGSIVSDSAGELAFEEIAATPLLHDEIETLLAGVEDLTANGVTELLVFYYPRDWRMGEIIWTPTAENVLPVRERYKSASSVTAVELPKLRAQMLAEDVCMTLVLADVPEDRRMAYQHQRRDRFFTRVGVDKLTGARQMAEHLGVDLDHSVGAGDTEMDVFLQGVGLAVAVGRSDLPFRGTHDTLFLRDSSELGDLLFKFAALQREIGR